MQGYEIVLPSQSGTINVASGARFDISGGPGGANIANTGGTVYLRAPIVENADGSHRSVNVNFNGTLITNADANGRPSGKGLVLEPYAVWSTADQQSDLTKYFDGIIDPAGWYSSGGVLVAGTFTDATGAVISSWSGSSAPSFSNVSSVPFTKGTGTKVLTVQAGLDLSPGDPVVIANGTTASAQTNVGTVVSYDSRTGALVLNITVSFESLARSFSQPYVYYGKGGIFIPIPPQGVPGFQPRIWSPDSPVCGRQRHPIFHSKGSASSQPSIVSWCRKRHHRRGGRPPWLCPVYGHGKEGLRGSIWIER